MKKTIIISIASLIILQPAFAAKSAFYLGVNGIINNIHTKNQLQFDPTKVLNSSTLDTNIASNQIKSSAEILIGSQITKDAIFGAIEAWYNPTSFDTSTSTANGSFKTTIATRYGARIKLGTQNKNVTLYGILGLGTAKSAINGLSGVYNTRPGVVLTGSYSKAQLSSVGAGVNASYSNGINISLEYLYQKINNGSTVLNDRFITHLNPIGTANGELSFNSINIGVKYQFKPFII